MTTRSIEIVKKKKKTRQKQKQIDNKINRYEKQNIYRNQAGLLDSTGIGQADRPKDSSKKKKIVAQGDIILSKSKRVEISLKLCFKSVHRRCPS